MKPNKFSEKARALKTADIEAVEKKLGFALPKELIAHYLAQNGGTPSRQLFRAADGHEHSVDLFLPMRFESYEDETLLEDNYLELVAKDKRLPAHLIPFAEDEGGDPYCIDRRDQKIYYFAMDHEDDPKRATRFVTDSLATFVDGMQTPREFYAKDTATKKPAAKEVATKKPAAKKPAGKKPAAKKRAR